MRRHAIVAISLFVLGFTFCFDQEPVFALSGPLPKDCAKRDKEGKKHYLHIGTNPADIQRQFNLREGEKKIRLLEEMCFTMTDKSRKVSTGWVPENTWVIGKKTDRGWKILAIAECGNPILNKVYAEAPPKTRAAVEIPAEPQLPKNYKSIDCDASGGFSGDCGKYLVNFPKSLPPGNYLVEEDVPERCIIPETGYDLGQGGAVGIVSVITPFPWNIPAGIATYGIMELAEESLLKWYHKKTGTERYKANRWCKWLAEAGGAGIGYMGGQAFKSSDAPPSQQTSTGSGNNNSGNPGNPNPPGGPTSPATP